MLATNEREIWRAYDAWGVIRVVEAGPYRFLCFGEELETEQACILIHRPDWVEYDYVQAMLMTGVFHSKPKRALVLGLGAGTLPRGLRRLLPELQMDVVELRGQVYEAAKQFFEFPEADPQMKIHVMDAVEFIHNAELDAYDLILADIYLEEGMASAQGTAAFLDQCNRLLKRDGIIVLNQWQRGQSGHPQNEELFKACYPGRYWLLPVEEGNVVVYAFPHQTPEAPSRQLVDAMRQAGRRMELPFGRLLSRLNIPSAQ
ncbi:spermidine synthase [Pokkaliibacter plantistimulans]|uniref:Spermidine synthase n=1 Tax=Proteobacteria bacterium 228 TaxID=2083153 RepID=A0A2S5KS84_9PROT|nr:fused MFS/spermidine synthase [Pokkaliibacter plantistimulans]PPC77525.1 spermidine synthase [Pokkaliibacter plantistimulans]